MTKFKIALLYRGQLRLVDHGVTWLRRLRKQLGEDKGVSEIKTFCHTSCTIMEMFETPVLDLAKTPLRENTIITLEEAQKQILKFKPTGMRIFNAPHIYRDAQNIIDYWIRNPEFPRFYCDQTPGNTFIKIIMLKNYYTDQSLLGRNNAQREMYFINQIVLGDYISQYISAGHSLQMLNVYVEEHNWVPDLIISLRYDSAVDVNNLNKLVDQVTTYDHIFGNGIVIRRGKGHTDDVAFAMNYDAAQMFLGDIDNRVYEIMTNWKDVASLIGPVDNMEGHQFWNLLTRQNIAIESTPFFRSSIMRAGVDTALNLKTASITEIKKHFVEWREEYLSQLGTLPEDKKHGDKTLDYALNLLDIKKEDVF